MPFFISLPNIMPGEYLRRFNRYTGSIPIEQTTSRVQSHLRIIRNLCYTTRHGIRSDTVFTKIMTYPVIIIKFNRITQSITYGSTDQTACYLIQKSFIIEIIHILILLLFQLPSPYFIHSCDHIDMCYHILQLFD